MLLTMNPCMIASGPTPNPCIIHTAPMQIMSKPTSVVTIFMSTSNMAALLPRVDVEHVLTFGRHAVADLLVLSRARRRRQTLGQRLRDLAFVHALARERVRDRAIALVARILEHLVTRPRRDHHAHRPRRRVRA